MVLSGRLCVRVLPVRGHRGFTHVTADEAARRATVGLVVAPRRRGELAQRRRRRARRPHGGDLERADGPARRARRGPARHPPDAGAVAVPERRHPLVAGHLQPARRRPARRCSTRSSTRPRTATPDGVDLGPPTAAVAAGPDGGHGRHGLLGLERARGRHRVVRGAAAAVRAGRPAPGWTSPATARLLHPDDVPMIEAALAEAMRELHAVQLHPPDAASAQRRGAGLRVPRRGVRRRRRRAGPAARHGPGHHRAAPGAAGAGLPGRARSADRDRQPAADHRPAGRVRPAARAAPRCC